MIKKIEDVNAKASNLRRFTGVYIATIQTKYYDSVPIVFGLHYTGDRHLEKKDIFPFHVPANSSRQEIQEAIFDEIEMGGLCIDEQV